MPQAGEIVLLPFPFTDLSSEKRRPALVLKNSDERGDFLALAITSREQAAPALPLMQFDLVTGQLPRPSWIRTDKIYTFNSVIVVAHFGQLAVERLAQARQLVCAHLDCHSPD